MQAAPQCRQCDRARVLVGVEPIARGYDVGLFECPACKTILRLVERRQVRTVIFPRRLKTQRRPAEYNRRTALVRSRALKCPSANPQPSRPAGSINPGKIRSRAGPLTRS